MIDLTEIKIPFSGSVENVEITEWIVTEGDLVTEGQALADVSTDKVDTELESPEAGRIVRFLVPGGTELKVGSSVALLAPADANDDDIKQALAEYTPTPGS
jgi:pyruvate/2-oxoglutarate dehydrogenase complex dihydrolipoamide acyltransferase (E2) component